MHATKYRCSNLCLESARCSLRRGERALFTASWCGPPPLYAGRPVTLEQPCAHSGACRVRAARRISSRPWRERVCGGVGQPGSASLERMRVAGREGCRGSRHTRGGRKCVPSEPKNTIRERKWDVRVPVHGRKQRSLSCLLDRCSRPQRCLPALIPALIALSPPLPLEFFSRTASVCLPAALHVPRASQKRWCS